MDIVLVEPETPQNTGSIARTCAATETPLHLVEPMKFQIDEKKVKRAGLDYWPYVDLTVHKSWAAYQSSRNPARIWCVTVYGETQYTKADFGPNDAIVFGSESKGLDPGFLATFPATQLLTIPMSSQHVRSINLSNAVAIVLYEARRQLSLDQEITIRQRALNTRQL